MNNRKYVSRLIAIILLTNIPVALTLPLFFRVSLGWILGSIASALNLLWLAHNVNASLSLVPNKSKLKAVKGTYLRLLALLVYSILVLSFLKPSIIGFGLGLLAGQMVIYLYEFIRRFFKQGE
jgi:ATP synthase I subunit